MSSGSPQLASMAILALFLVLLLGQILKHFSRCSGVPYTPVLLILGLIIGLLHKSLGDFGEGINSWNNIHPKTFLLLFMPPLIFESAFNADWHTFKREIWQVILLAGPSLLISMFLTGTVLYYVLDYQSEISLTAAFMFGAIISATDPVAVVALLKELGASKRFATLIEGESLLNDGTALVMFDITLELVRGSSFDFGHALLSFVRLSFGGVVLGIVFGYIVNYLIKRILNNLVLEFNLTLVSAYLIFYAAEDSPLKVSGILSLVFLGLYMTISRRTAISVDSEAGVHHIWSYLGFLAETAIFCAAGVFIGTKLLDSNIFWQDYLKLLALWVLLQLIRFIAILTLWPILRKLGYGLSFKQLLVLTYGGLRGAVGLLLALVVDLQDSIDRRTRDLVVFHVGGIAFLSLIINGTTIRFLISKLGISRVSRVQQKIMRAVVQMFHQKGIDAVKQLRKKKHFNLTDWELVKSRVSVDKFYPHLKKMQLLAGTEKPYAISPAGQEEEEEEEEQGFVDMKDYTKEELQVEARVRFLKMLKGNYWHAWENGFCSANAANRLIEAADRALDHCHAEIQDWDHLKSIVKAHSQHKCRKCTRALFKSRCCGRFLKHFFIHRVSLSYDICVNYIEAHQYVRRVQDEIIADPDISQRIDQESKEQSEKAEKYLHSNFDGLYPQLAKVVQNKRAVYFSLKQMSAFVHELENLGKVSAKEAGALLALNQKRIQRIMFHAPEADLPDVRSLAMASELSDFIAPEQLKQLIAKANQLQLDSQEFLYKQGDPIPKNIYFVARGGVVERRENSQWAHKICHLFGLAHLSGVKECIASAFAFGFTEVLEIPTDDLLSLVEPDKCEQLWRLVALHAIKSAPDLFGPLKKFDRAEVSQILEQSSFVIFQENELIDLTSGALFIQGEAIGTREKNYMVGLLSPPPVDARSVTEQEPSIAGGDYKDLLKVQERLTQLEKQSSQLEVPQKKKQNNGGLQHSEDTVFFKAFRFIYPMEGMIARALVVSTFVQAQTCKLLILPAALRDSWLSHHAALANLNRRGALGTMTMALEKHQNIHKVGLPLQLVPGSMRISGFDGQRYEEEQSERGRARKKSNALGSLFVGGTSQGSVHSQDLVK